MCMNYLMIPARHSFLPAQWSDELKNHPRPVKMSDGIFIIAGLVHVHRRAFRA